MSDQIEIQFGLETEYGITRDGAERLDVVEESIALVRSVTEPGVLMRWDYESENPHKDARGFEVEELRQDFDEARYFSQDRNRQLSFTEIKSDFILANGSRFYNDHAHPEYCTPECRSLDDLIVQDRAGEFIVAACAKRLSEERGSAVRIYKNNTDFRGHSYGCHENYLIPRSIPWNDLVRAVQSFLITRQIFAGAGKFAVEAEDQLVGTEFQLTQRGDFFSELQSVDTMQRRPIINTRDEPHAEPRRFRRFHVILGDANMSSFATRLKVGTTALVLEAIARDPRRSWPGLRDPVSTLKAISRDPEFKWPVRLTEGRNSTALEVQRAYLKAVNEVCDLNSLAKKQLVHEWQSVLDDLEADWTRCRDRLDWVAKWSMIREFQSAEGIADDDPWLRSLDLEYHLLDRERGLYAGLEQAGMMRMTPTRAGIQKAVSSPPENTRAYIRGKCVEKFADLIISAQWDHVTLQTRQGPFKVSLMNLFSNEVIQKYAKAVDESTSPDDFQEKLIQKGIACLNSQENANP